MKVGVMAPYGDGLVTSGAFLREYVGVLEANGVESVWTVEHVVVADAYEPRYPYSADGLMPGGHATGAAVPMPDPLELLAFMAACSSTLRLGTAVVVAPLHSPVVLAKRAATVDRLSGGRLLLGLGIGWQIEEYAAVGAPYEGRGARLDECIAAMRALWSAQGAASYVGRSVSFDRVHSVPRPTHGSIPIVLGGNSAAAVRRAGCVADGWFPYTVGPDELASGVAALHAAAVGAGRDPSVIEVTVWPGSCDPAREMDVEWVRRFVAAGATRLIVRPRLSAPDQLPALAAQLQQYRQDVVDKL